MACSRSTVPRWPVTAVPLWVPLSFDPGVRLCDAPKRLRCRLREVAVHGIPENASLPTSRGVLTCTCHEISVVLRGQSEPPPAATGHEATKNAEQSASEASPLLRRPDVLVVLRLCPGHHGIGRAFCRAAAGQAGHGRPARRKYTPHAAAGQGLYPQCLDTRPCSVG